jgi:Response regulator containing a CheY-like receiver domain and an HTH DNA-binding domain
MTEDRMTRQLTPRQYEAARLIASGTTRSETARRLGVTPSCVDQHIRAASKRLGVAGRRELAAALLECDVAKRPRVGRFGMTRGQAVQIIGGRYVGRSATYLKAANSVQVLLAIGAGRIAVTARFVEPVREAA